ncbi:hypothetical protein AURDEDRAFT_149843 [Auricularia subglabra TFB-10046 SS5]|nr:hypothetical protein AURDEDRAFT_149843 [Auricularia subglabra TFB-10046 SS5]
MLTLLLAAVLAFPFVNAQAPGWGQCGGLGWTGPTTCASEYVCTFINQYFSQCLPSSPTTTTTATPTPTPTLPAVVVLDAFNQPPPPSDLKYVHIVDPNSLQTDNTHYPVLQYQGLNFWALSFVDNRVAFSILAYDADGELYARWDRTGARYLYTIKPSGSSVAFLGQSSAAVTFTLAELLSPPAQVVIRNANLQPPLPANPALKYTHLTNPYTLDVDNTVYPVLQLGNLSIWAASYIDNRVSYNMLSYTRCGRLWNACEFPGARYVYSVAIDASSAAFYGQSLDYVSATFDQLRTLCGVVFTLNANLQPPPPAGVNYFHLTNPFNLNGDNTQYPVLYIGEMAFWALSFNDNRVSFAILVYDAGGDLAAAFELPGARYIYQITAQNGSASFIGQSLGTVTVPLTTLRNTAGTSELPGTLASPLKMLSFT